jgi:dihydroxyacetone kinase
MHGLCRQAIAHALQTRLGFLRHGCYGGVVYQFCHDIWVEKTDGDFAVCVFAHDDVARQQQANVSFSIQCLVGQRRVACPECDRAACRY